MMPSATVAQAMQAVSRPIFTTREIAALRTASLSSTSQALGRLEEKRLVVGVARGVWCVPTDPRFTPFGLVGFLSGDPQAYVSFLTALHLHGIVGQVPQVIYAATTRHTRRVRTPVGEFSFHRIQPAFFAGFDWYRGRQDFLIAAPEKALVDCLYLSAKRGNRFGSFPELILDRGFSWRRADHWVQRIPDAKTREHARRLLKALRSEAR